MYYWKLVRNKANLLNQNDPLPENHRFIYATIGLAKERYGHFPEVTVELRESDIHRKPTFSSSKTFLSVFDAKEYVYDALSIQGIVDEDSLESLEEMLRDRENDI
jgi:hypothetical protein